MGSSVGMNFMSPFQLGGLSGAGAAGAAGGAEAAGSVGADFGGEPAQNLGLEGITLGADRGMNPLFGGLDETA